jgi:phage shock protein PspC (stress-responsive transcriptional regulator)
LEQQPETRNLKPETRNLKPETNMKKTLSINISGFVFHIDEDAYEKLHRYLEAIKSHFRGFEGKDEVISDVEARVAEILQKKISSSKEVIIMEDVDEVIGILGQPSDFGMDDEDAASRKEFSYSILPKRLYRDPERKVFGGVCSGLGAYFNLDPVWVRVIFIFMVLISGFGLLLYLILWMVVPEARTTAERLEMRGKPVNISNIEKSLGEEVNHLKDKLNDMTSKARYSYRKKKEEFDRTHRDQFLDSIGDIGRVFLRIFLIIAGTIILLLGIALTIAYLSIVFRFPMITLMDHAGVHTFPLYPVIDRIFDNDADLRTFATGLMVLAGLPLLMMLWGGIRLIFNLARTKFVSGLAGIIWLCALVITLVFGFKVANSFHYQGNFSKESILEITKPDTLQLVTIRNLPQTPAWNHSDMIEIPEWRLAVSEDANVFYCIPELKIKPSSDSTARLIVTTSARGPFSREAAEKAENINYKWHLKSDTLYLSDSFILSKEEKWRKQETMLQLYLPVGTVFHIDKNMSPILGYHKNYSRHDMIGTMFIMTKEGLVRAGSSQ